jgi:hypothetical protein
MKKLLFILLLLGFGFSAMAQDQPKVGDVLEINEPYGQKFNHVNFPKVNTLIKRGKVGNYNSVYGDQVIVSEVNTKKDGSTYVILKKKDDTKFFGYLKDVKANYQAAVESGELTIVN